MTAQLPSKARLEALASGNAFTCVQDDEAAAMASAILAAHEQEPVMEVRSYFNGEYVCRKLTKGALKPGVKLYYNPVPVPAVPNEISTTDAMKIMNGRIITMSLHTAYKNGWNACRAAMLNGGKS